MNYTKKINRMQLAQKIRMLMEYGVHHVSHRQKSFFILYFSFLTFLFSSCGSPKSVLYLQEIGKGQTELAEMYRQHNVKIQPEDELSIIVNTGKEPLLAEAFNLEARKGSTLQSLTYIVDENGDISFPFIGKVQVQGLTRSEVETKLETALKKYIKDEPTVRVELLNFRVFMLGETGSRQLSIEKERLNVLEALSMAGDMGIQGNRKTVTVLREDSDGVVRAGRLDLTSTQIYDSPYFYLKQNDMIYVEPNKVRSWAATTGSQVSIIIGISSALVSVTSLILLLSR